MFSNLTSSDVPKLDHVVNLAPSVLANPAITAGVIRVDDNGEGVHVAVDWGSNPIVLILFSNRFLAVKSFPTHQQTG